MSSIDFSVIIPTYDDWARLLNCIKALELQKFDKDRYEVLVINNSKINEIPSDFNVPDFVNVLHQPVPGSYAARASGAEAAKGKILAFTDSDCIPAPDWLRNAAKCFSDNSCSLIGGKIELFKKDEGSQTAYIFEKYTAFQQHDTVPEGKSVTANLFVKKTTFEQLNGFNEKMKSGGDWEFTKRAVNEGFNLEYADDVVVKHPARRSLRDVFSKQRRIAAWGLLNNKKRYGYSTPRIILSTVKGGLLQMAEILRKNIKLQHRLLITVIQSWIITYKLILQMGIWFKLIDPKKIRE